VNVLLSLLAGLTVLLIFVGLAYRPRRIRRLQAETLLPGIQVRLDRAQLAVSASTYVLRSVLVGLGFGIVMFLATGAWLVIPVGVASGFAFVWSRLEDERNERLNRYHKALASAADTIVNSWRVRPSMNRALEAVERYGQMDVAEDFREVRLALRGGRSLSEALQRVADRRQSPIFDALATALILAEDSSGEVSEMLSQQAETTRTMAQIYEETIDAQRGQRVDVMWGIVGPWAILGLLRVFTFFVGGIGFGIEFFQTPAGQVVAIAAAALTILAYVHAHRTAGRGLVVGRVELELGKGV